MLNNNERIKKVEETLNERVMGQPHVIKSICRTLKNAYSGIRNHNKPIGIFVFGGQSGTGKTYLAKELTKSLFNKDSSFIRIDMTEFSESHSVSKIIGSPPGYVGFNQVDVISDKIRKRPYCVLLLDEVEKAHPDVIKLFLQVMSDGYFTDSIGNKVNCKNIILIMTGNFGMNEASKADLGFGSDNSLTEKGKEQKRLIDFCKSNYGVEFINRVDEFIPFIPLNDDSILKIISLKLKELKSRINVDVTFSKNVIDRLLLNSKNEHGLNATIIDRLISKEIEPVIADRLLEIGDNKNDKLWIEVLEENNEIISKLIKSKIDKQSVAKTKKG
jgi:ATP-dependent Clp protease ATP-binding subunit ClpC